MTEQETRLVAVVTGDSVALTWAASTDDVGVTGYQVHRGSSADFTPSAGTLVDTVTGTTFTDADRPAATAYYRIVAVDAAGNLSEPSQAAEAIVPDVTAPSTPGGVTAVAGGDPEIVVSWTASTDDLGVSGYDVYRGTTRVGQTTGTTFTDTGLTAATAYQYTVRARDVAGNVSAASTAVTVTTKSDTTPDTTAPSSPAPIPGRSPEPPESESEAPTSGDSEAGDN